MGKRKQLSKNEKKNISVLFKDSKTEKVFPTKKVFPCPPIRQELQCTTIYRNKICLQCLK